MTDVLKLAEEALEPLGNLAQEWVNAAASAAHPLSSTHDRKIEHSDREAFNNALEQALAALRAALAEWDWRPIAEMEDYEEFNQATILGRWGVWYGTPPERWCLGNCGHMSRSEAIKSGYTHFCCPQLPQPPAREDVGNG